MKYKSLQIIFYIILLLLVIYFLYYLYIQHKKDIMIKQILHHWKEKIGGYIKRDKRGLYAGDYYLNFTKTLDNTTHIHLSKNIFYSKYGDFSFSNILFELIPTATLGYVIQKNNRHLYPMKIDEKDSPDKICLHLIKLYENFDMNYYNSK